MNLVHVLKTIQNNYYRVDYEKSTIENGRATIFTERKGVCITLLSISSGSYHSIWWRVTINNKQFGAGTIKDIATIDSVLHCLCDISMNYNMEMVI